MTTQPLTARFEIVNDKGLHARASFKFVEVASQFEAKALVRCNNEVAEATSILDLLTLGAAKGCHLEITATGADAAGLLAALGSLIAGRFGEES